MAVTIAVSFLLVIPIEPIYWLLALPAGLLIGYYANQRVRSRAGGPWRRILANALFAGLATGVTLAAPAARVKALFFFADDGYRDASVGRPAHLRSRARTASTSATWQLARARVLAAAGITDVDSFTALLLEPAAQHGGWAGDRDGRRRGCWRRDLPAHQRQEARGGDGGTDPRLTTRTAR